MPSNRSFTGQLLASAGGGLLIVELFQPWYELRLPPALAQGAAALAPQLGILGDYVRRGAAMLLAAGPLKVSAWDAFREINIALLVLAVLAIGLTVLAFAGRANRVGQLIALLGLAAASLVAYRIISPPGPQNPQGGGPLLHVVKGAWLALGAGVAIMVGGALQSVGELRVQRRREDAPASWPPPSSVIASAGSRAPAPPAEWW